MKVKIDFEAHLRTGLNADLATRNKYYSVHLHRPRHRTDNRRRHNRLQGLDLAHTLPFGLEISVWTHRYPRDLCGIPKDYDIDWILDEFDSSFDVLAVASLRYHLDYAITDSTWKRPRYEALIRQFEQAQEARNVLLTDEEQEHLKSYTIPQLLTHGPECEPCKAPQARVMAAETESRRLQDQARHDFIEILPELWS